MGGIRIISAKGSLLQLTGETGEAGASTLRPGPHELQEQLGAAQRRLAQLQEEHRIELAEARHRFANSFQLLSSLISFRMNGASAEEGRSHLLWLQQMVGILGRLHGQLLAVEGRRLQAALREIAPLWEKLCAAQQVELELDLQDFEIAEKKTTPLTLGLHELLTNCLEHAFPGGGGGKVVLCLDRSPEGEGRLMVKDNGIGAPLDREVQSNGLKLVERLAAQAEGRLLRVNGAGCTAAILFQVP